MAIPSSSNYPGALDSVSSLYGYPANQSQFTTASVTAAAATSCVVTESVAALSLPLLMVFTDTGEIVYVTAKDDGTKTLTIERGVAGGPAGSEHAGGSTLRVVMVADYLHQLKRAVIAIETELGVDPAGAYATVVARLNAMDDAATSTSAGLVELATGAETITGTDDTRAVTPAGLAAKVASTTAAGIAEIATGAEVITGTDDTRTVSPKAITDAGITCLPLIGGIPHKQLWLGNLKPTITSGCQTSAQIEMSTNKNVYDYLAFDASMIECAFENKVMPQDYTGGTIYAVMYWTHPATTTNFKVSWGIQAVSFSNDDTLDAAQGTVIYSNDTGGTTSDLYVSPQTSAITIAGSPVAGDLVNFRVLRKADDGTNDTLAVDAYLIGVLVYYPVS